MRYVLDTNVVSEAMKPNPDPNCVNWLRAHASDCCITTITLAELRFGVERLPDGRKRREFERKIEFIRQDFSDWILDFDQNAAAEFGRYAAEFEATHGHAALEQMDVRDLQIAAITRANAWTVATRNQRDFPFLPTINPFR